MQYIESIESEDEDKEAKQSLVRLKAKKSVQGENSGLSTLASWYSGLKPSKMLILFFPN
jgi:hypothetical protein